MKTKGFTLIEVLMVMVVLVAMATITVKSVGQFSFDNRYQITQDRYEKIRTAILGNPNQTINGHPSVSGFVADMGRLPNCLRELIDGTNCSPTGYCSDGTNSDQTTCLATAGNLWKDAEGDCSDGTTSDLATCLAAGNLWKDKIYQIDPLTGLGYGWRGAYISTTSNPENSNAFTDGWGNTAKCFDLVNYHQIPTTQESCENNGHKWYGYSNLEDIPKDSNYGWFFDNYSESNELTIKSYGRDGLLDALVTPIVEYDKDFPENPAPMVNKNEWQIGSPVVVSVNVTPPSSTTPPPTKQICLNMYYKENGKITPIPPSNSQITENGNTQNISFSLTVIIPVGQAAFKITNYDTTTSSCTPITYPTAGRDFKIVDILPNRSLTFDW